MKLLFTSLALSFITLSISAQEFKFEKETINYGKISQNSNGIRVFVFTNIGDRSFLITKVTSFLRLYYS